jgi:Dual specificity phosphatase, catalytic domain
MSFTPSTLAAVRQATGLVRPLHNHGCPPVEVVPGLWTAHFHDVESLSALQAISPSLTTIINTATDKCPTREGSYGPGITVVVVEGLLDDPDARKKVDSMPEGPEKDAARAALPIFPPSECAGDAKKDFERVNAAIEDARAGGGAALLHCYASLSRSVAFVLAYLMRSRELSVVQAVQLMKPKWDACWPADDFVAQLIAYEAELAAERSTV